MSKLLEKINELEKSVNKNSGDPDIYYQLMRLFEYVHPAKAARYFDLIKQTEEQRESRIWVGALALSPGFLITQTLMEEAINNIDVALHLAQKHNYGLEGLQASIFKFLILAYTGRNEESKQLITWCESQLSLYSDVQTEIFFYQLAGDSSIQTDFKKAGEYLFKAAELSRFYNRPCDEANALSKICDWCEFTGDYESGYRYADEAIKISEEQGATTIVLQASLFAINLAFKTIRTGRAEVDLDRALKAAEQIDEKPMYNYVLQKKAAILATLDKYEDAITLQHYLLEVHKEKDDKNAMAGAHMSLGKSYYHQQRYEEALHHLTQYKILKGDKIRTDELTIYNLDISQNYAGLGSYKLAYEHLYEYMKIQYRLQDETRAREMGAMQAKYETERKELAIKRLELENSEAMLKAIKAQMNPHFIFNVMNTIDSLIGANENDHARTALLKFAALMRDTLLHSNLQLITIEEEIELLKNYIELEKLSLGSSFIFSITEDERLDTSYMKIPSMLLQPIVENAIKHGLRHLAGEKMLQVHFGFKSDDAFTVTVTDNGIGRKKSAEINAARKNHQSFATSAIEQRIKATNQQGSIFIGLEVQDAAMEAKNPGTKVQLVFTLPS